MDDHTITSWADRHMFREIRSASKNKELTLIALFWLLLLPRALVAVVSTDQTKAIL